MNNEFSDYQKANKLLDAAQYEEAIRLYKQSLRMDKAHGNILANLQIAQALSEIQFADQLIHENPTSSVFHLYRVRVEIERNGARQAVKLSTQYMEKFRSQENVYKQLILLRLNAAIKAQNPQYFAEDFRETWAQLKQQGKQKLIEQILSINSPMFTADLKSLMNDNSLPGSVRSIIKMKLQIIEQLLQLNTDDL